MTVKDVDFLPGTYSFSLLAQYHVLCVAIIQWWTVTE